MSTCCFCKVRVGLSLSELSPQAPVLTPITISKVYCNAFLCTMAILIKTFLNHVYHFIFKYLPYDNVLNRVIELYVVSRTFSFESGDLFL